MSHFTVAVITDGKPNSNIIDDMLVRYSEDIEVCPVEYLKFSNEEDYIRERYESDIAKAVKLIDGSVVPLESDMFKRYMLEEEAKENFAQRRWDYTKKQYFLYDPSIISGTVEVETPVKELYSFSEYAINEGYVFDKEEQAYGYYYNPNAYWDWYSIGGRWAGSLTVSANADCITGDPSPFCKDNPYQSKYSTIKRCDSARIKDLVFLNNDKDYGHLWDVMNGLAEPANEDEKHVNIYFGKYKNVDREKFVEAMSCFSTYAVITKDGKWKAPGTMGWWACSSEEADESVAFRLGYKKNFLDTAGENDWITIVDCHI